MKREIKFRAWYKEENKLVYADINDMFDVHYWDGAQASIVGMVNFLFEDSVYNNIDWMQYTGLKDKNGVEIYEGDIISNRHTKQRYIYEGSVFFKDGIFFVDCQLTDELLMVVINDNYKCKVIGNIHENPELLK